MSDQTTPAEDELVTAVLDGEATASERAMVEGEERLRARLRAFERGRAATRDVARVTDEARDATIDRALHASDAPAPTVLTLERERRRRRIATIIAVAAAVLVVVPLLAITLLGGGSDTQLTATGSDDASEQSVAGDANPTSTLAPLGEAAAGASAEAPVDAGDFGLLTSTGQLRSDVQNALADAGRSTSLRSSSPQSTTTVPGENQNFDRAPTGPTVDRCTSAIAATDPTLGPAVLTATATWSGEPAIIVVFRTLVPAGPGEPTDVPTDVPVDVIVVARPDCTTIERFLA